MIDEKAWHPEIHQKLREDALHTTHKPTVFPMTQKPVISAEKCPGHHKPRTNPGWILMTEIH